MAQLCAHKIAQEQQKAKRKISPREASPQGNIALRHFDADAISIPVTAT